MKPSTDAIISALAEAMPSVLRWSGAVARRLREFNIAVEGKESGNANTDALTLADLSVQELIVAALRDADPVLRHCRVEGEEETGDLRFFDDDAGLAIAIDPIDGTKQYRDRSGNGYAVMLHLHSDTDPLYSLVFVPETGANGTWVEVTPDRMVCGEDDPSRAARAVLDALPDCSTTRQTDSDRIYMIGFQDQDPNRAADVDGIGLRGVISENMPGSVYPLMATGAFAGSLIHSPNIYDFPVSMHIARRLGGEALWVDSRRPVHYRELWMDDRAGMLRFPGIVACSDRSDVNEKLCDLAADWNPIRYTD